MRGLDCRPLLTGLLLWWGWRPQPLRPTTDHPGLVVLRIMITAFAAPMTLQVASTVALTVPAADRQRVATSPFAFRKYPLNTGDFHTLLGR
jgi:hypothetical protein